MRDVCARGALPTVHIQALETGHLEKPFEGAPAGGDAMLTAVLTKDNNVVANTGMMCSQAQTRDQMQAQASGMHALDALPYL